MNGYNVLFKRIFVCYNRTKEAMYLQYGEVRQAHFLERPNRFIAHVELEGETVV